MKHFKTWILFALFLLHMVISLTGQHIGSIDGMVDGLLLLSAIEFYNYEKYIEVLEKK